MRPVCAYTDFFVVCSGQNPRQTKAIVDEVRYGLKHGDERLLPHAVEGEREGDWIVADYLDVVLHVFTPETRDYYGLEQLWDDVPSIEHATAELSGDLSAESTRLRLASSLLRQLGDGTWIPARVQRVTARKQPAVNR